MTLTCHPSPDAAKRAWRLHAMLLIGSGIVAAAQIGKAIITVPSIRDDLSLGLDLAGLLQRILIVDAATKQSLVRSAEAPSTH